MPPKTRSGNKDNNEAPSETSVPTTGRTVDAGVPNIDTSDLSELNQVIVDRIIKGVVSYFQEVMKNRERDLQEAKSCIKKLEKRVSHLEEQLDETNSYERRDTLVISGQIPEVREGEDCNKIVRELLKDIRLSVPATEISTAHRLGRKPINGRPDHRNIIFKLCRRDLKRDILDACRQQKPNYYINESPTPSRNAILYVLRKAKQQNPEVIGNARSYDGNIHLWQPSADPSSNSRFNKIIINTKCKLEEILRDKLNCGSDKFINRWPAIV